MKALRLGSLAVLGLLAAGSAGALSTNSRCVGNLQSPLSPGNSCTANDVTFVFVGLGDQTDGCLSTTDTVSLYMGVRLENTSGQTRYDIGLFIYNYLGTGDPTPDAFGGQQCAVENLEPAYGTTGTSTCGPLNLSGGSGPFYNADGNACADLVKGQCNSSPVFMTYTSPLTIKCTDSVGANGSTTPDGFVDIPACTTWGNNVGQVGPGGSCNSEADIMPGTGSKCRCETINSTIPVARLAASCSCNPGTVRPGQSAACTVSFTNTVPNCTAANSGASNERFQCGTASYVRYKVGYNAAQGQVLNSASSPATPSETTGGSVTVDTANSRVVWQPRNTTASGSSVGVIGPNESGSMTYQFYVDPSVASGTTITQTVTPYWSNVGPTAWTNEVAQSTVNCSFTVSNAATYSRVSSFAARSEGGQVVVAWETAAEVGTVAFEVEREDPASGRFVRLTGRPVPAVAQLPGGRYRLVDPTAPRGQALTYRLIEVDQQGGREILGPFRVEVAEVAAGDPKGEDFQVRAKAVSDRLARAVLTRKAAPAFAGPQTARRAKIEVAQSGPQQVRVADIASALGLTGGEVSAQLRAGRIRLSRAGQDVAWQPAADGNGLVFHGEELHTAYTDVNVYWLEIGRGQSMATLAASPAAGTPAASFLDTLHLETDAIPAVASPKPVDDFWIWKSLFPGFPGFDRATIQATVPAPATGAATLTVHLAGFAPAQRAEVWLNGARVGDLSWEGDGPVSLPVALPSGSLRDGANQIEVVAVEAARGLWLDAFDLTYPRQYRAEAGRLAFRAEAGRAVTVTGFATPDIAVYDVAQPLAPRRLGGLSSVPQAGGSWGVSFTAPGAGPFVAATTAALAGPRLRASAPLDLQSPDRAAAYLVITVPELHAEAQRLADLRSAQGLSSLVVDVGDVMDVFGSGISDPQAIQRFLAYALRSWSTPPRYVVLAGKGSYDYRNLLGLSSNLVPPLLVATEAGLAPADAAYADLGSGLPAVAIGRIPALTAAEMRAFVDKVIAYENDPGGTWTSQVLLAADTADFGGDFPASSETVAAALPPGLGLSRVDSPVDGAQMPATRAQLQDALRGGQVLMNYIGHGGLDRLDSEGLLLTSDVAQLHNAPRLPVLTALTCLISQFAYPTVTSLGEELVLRSDGGAIAVYGPTWLSHNTPATALGGNLMPQLAAPGGGRLGDRLQRGLQAYAAAGGDRKMVRLYTLLGDPGLVVKR